MSEDLYKKIIMETIVMGVPSIKLNWRGEPLLNPKMSKMISYAKEKGILEVMINTNAVSLNEKKAIEIIVDKALEFELGARGLRKITLQQDHLWQKKVLNMFMKI